MKSLKNYQPTEKEENGISQWVTIPQGTLEPWSGDIDATDGAIVGYITTFATRDKAEKHPADDRFTWINLGYLLKCLPILNIEYRTLARRIKKLDNLGIITRKYTIDGTGQRRLFISVNADDHQDKPEKKDADK